MDIEGWADNLVSILRWRIHNATTVVIANKVGDILAKTQGAPEECIRAASEAGKYGKELTKSDTLVAIPVYIHRETFCRIGSVALQVSVPMQDLRRQVKATLEAHYRSIIVDIPLNMQIRG